jgi:hypothetical protein
MSVLDLAGDPLLGRHDGGDSGIRTPERGASSTSLGASSHVSETLRQDLCPQELLSTRELQPPF